MFSCLAYNWPTMLVSEDKIIDIKHCFLSCNTVIVRNLTIFSIFHDKQDQMNLDL